MAPKTRRGKKRKKEEMENTMFRVFAIMLQNCWISPRDLCRLENTSTGVKKWIQQDEAWKTLCCSRFPNTLRISQPFVRNLGGYKRFFRHRISTLVAPKENSFPPLPPPSLTEDTVMLLVDISIAGESAYSDIISGKEDLGTLLETGSVAFSIKKPFVVGKASCWFQKGGFTCRECHFNLFEYDARLQLLSNADNGTFCCVYQPGEKEWSCTMEAESLGNGKYDWVDGEEEWLSCFQSCSHNDDDDGGLALRPTKEAAAIEQRLKGNVRFRFSISLTVIEPGDKIAVSGYEIEVVYKAYGKDDWEVFDSSYAKKKGVSLLHIFEQLQGAGRDEGLPKQRTAYVYEEHSIVALE